MIPVLIWCSNIISVCLWRVKQAGIGTSPVNKVFVYLGQTALSRDFGLRSISFVKMLPLHYTHGSWSKTITHSLDKERALLCLQTSRRQLGSTAMGVLVSLRYRHVLVYYQVIFQISNSIWLFWVVKYQKMISYPPKIIKGVVATPILVTWN